jgi:hypothetical protein
MDNWLTLDAGAGFGGDGAARSVMPAPLEREPILGVRACLELGEAMCEWWLGGLSEPAGGFGCECDSGLRGRP